MMMSARRQFLEAFLGALGAAEIINYSETADSANGTVRYAADAELLDLSDVGDEEELQDFCWDVSEDDLPDPLVYQLADLIHRFHLLDVDRLKVSRDTLHAMVVQDLEAEVNRIAFDEALDELKAIRVAMVEDGEEVDIFYIQEMVR